MFIKLKCSVQSMYTEQMNLFVAFVASLVRVVRAFLIYFIDCCSILYNARVIAAFFIYQWRKILQRNRLFFWLNALDALLLLQLKYSSVQVAELLNLSPFLLSQQRIMILDHEIINLGVRHHSCRPALSYLLLLHLLQIATSHHGNPQ